MGPWPIELLAEESLLPILHLFLPPHLPLFDPLAFDQQGDQRRNEGDEADRRHPGGPGTRREPAFQTEIHEMDGHQNQGQVSDSLAALPAPAPEGLGPPSESFSQLRCFGKINGQTQGFARGSLNPNSLRSPPQILADIDLVDLLRLQVLLAVLAKRSRCEEEVEEIGTDVAVVAE